MLDDGFVATFDNSKPLPKEVFVRFIMGAAQDKARKQAMTDRSLRLFGDTAVELGIDTISGTEDGKPFSVSSRFTAVYAKRGGAWKAVALHFGSARPGK